MTATDNEGVTTASEQDVMSGEEPGDRNTEVMGGPEPTPANTEVMGGPEPTRSGTTQNR